MKPQTRSSWTTVAAALLAGAEFLNPKLLPLAIFLLLIGMALGWAYIVRIPHWLTGAAIVVASGTLALIAINLATGAPFLRFIAVALALTTIASLAAEVFNPSPRGRVVATAAGMTTGGAIAASGAAWLASSKTVGAGSLVIAGAIAITVAAICSTLTANGGLNTVLAMVTGTGVGALLGTFMDPVTWYAGAVVGAGCAASVVLVSEMYRRQPPPPNAWAGISAAIAPVLIAGVLVYIGGRLLVG